MVEKVKTERANNNSETPLKFREWNKCLLEVGDKRIIINLRTLQLLEEQRKRIHDKVKD